MRQYLIEADDNIFIFTKKVFVWFISKLDSFNLA